MHNCDDWITDESSSVALTLKDDDLQQTSFSTQSTRDDAIGTWSESSHSHCSLHPSMIYSDVLLSSQNLLIEDELNITVPLETAMSHHHGSMQDPIEHHDKVAYLRVGCDLLDESMNHSIHSVQSSLQTESYFPSKLAFIRKFLFKKNTIASTSENQNVESSMEIPSWWSSFSTSDWEWLGESSALIYPALESDFFETVIDDSCPREITRSSDEASASEDRRKRVELIMATLLDNEDELFQSLKARERRRFFLGRPLSELALITLVLSIGIHNIVKRTR